MRAQPTRARRRGSTLVECAVIYNVLFLVLLGIMTLGLGVFRYQQVSWLSREASRWASVHGSLYAKSTGGTAATAADVYNQAVAPRAVALDPSLLSCDVTWSKSDGTAATSGRVYEMTVVNGSYTMTGNSVTVTVRYTWTPEAFGWPVVLTSSSTVPMAF
jgi:Flp pilus assembly protein TadG